MSEENKEATEEVQEPSTEKCPSLVMFNTATRFRSAISFLYSSTRDDNMRAHVWTDKDAEGIVTLHVQTEHGVYVNSDSTLKSELLDGDAWVNLRDFCVLCREVSQENNVTLWVDNGRLYVASSFNDDIEGFELECYCDPVEPFNYEEIGQSDFNETIKIEQGSFSIVTDSSFDFEWMEIHRHEGLLSYRSGNDRVVLATIVSSLETPKGLGTDDKLPDFAIRIPCDIFRIIPMLEIAQECTLNIDYTNKRIRIAGEVMKIDYSYKDAEFPAMSSEGFTDYMKFDTAAMVATIDTIYRVNYKNPVGNVKITPVDVGHASIEFSVDGRYGATVTMGEVHMLALEREITLPMDVITMMIRNANCKTLLLKVADDGKLMLCFSNQLFARKTYWLGN